MPDFQMPSFRPNGLTRRRPRFDLSVDQGGSRLPGSLRFRVYRQPLLRSARRALGRARRLVDRRPLVFVSAQRPLGPIFPELLASLRAAGLRPLWWDEHRGYLRIEDEIADSDAVIGVISRGSEGATCQIAELAFAGGFVGETRPADPRLRPLFIFQEAEANIAIDWLRLAPSPAIYLEPVPQAAAAQVAETLRSQRPT
jgi:hypothetical protein